MSNLRHTSQDGFTLIEVLVALAILSVSLGVLMRVMSVNLERVRVNQSDTTATLLLQSVISGLGQTIPLQAGVVEGHFSDGFDWRVEIAPYGTEADQTAWIVAPYAVTAFVIWHQGLRDRFVTAQSMRFGPKEARK
jgi:general secretion pathway protein I